MLWRFIAYEAAKGLDMYPDPKFYLSGKFLLDFLALQNLAGGCYRTEDVVERLHRQKT